MATSDALRDRTRRAVRAELSETALDLFIARGYDSTSVEQISAAVGLSRRSFFRYFAGKDELVLGWYHDMGEGFVDVLRGRPLTEPVWSSLRRVFDIATKDFSDAVTRDRTMAVQTMVEANANLLAGYLREQDRLQDELTDVLRDRAQERGENIPDDDPFLRALVGSAFACLRASLRSTRTTDNPQDVGQQLDAVMEAMQPRSRA